MKNSHNKGTGRRCAELKKERNEVEQGAVILGEGNRKLNGGKGK